MWSAKTDSGTCCRKAGTSKLSARVTQKNAVTTGMVSGPSGVSRLMVRRKRYSSLPEARSIFGFSRQQTELSVLCSTWVSSMSTFHCLKVADAVRLFATRKAWPLTALISAFLAAGAAAARKARSNLTTRTISVALLYMALSFISPAAAEVIRFDTKGNQIGQSHRRNPVKRYDAAGRLIAPPKPQAAADDLDTMDLEGEAMMLDRKSVV